MAFLLTHARMQMKFMNVCVCVRLLDEVQYARVFAFISPLSILRAYGIFLFPVQCERFVNVKVSFVRCLYVCVAKNPSYFFL